MGIDGKLIQFMNCQLLKDHKIVEDDLWVRDGIILNPYVVFFDENIAADIKIDCKGLLISPGYIDVQINGWLLCSFPLMSSKFLNSKGCSGKERSKHLKYNFLCKIIMNFFKKILRIAFAVNKSKIFCIAWLEKGHCYWIVLNFGKILNTGIEIIVKLSLIKSINLESTGSQDMLTDLVSNILTNHPILDVL